MEITIWGCRGSLPVSTHTARIRHKIGEALLAASGRTFENAQDVDDFIDNELPFPVWGSYGSNTCCIEVNGGGDGKVVIDCGSGLRDLGNAIVAEHGPSGGEYDFLMTHLHWDHLMGFPFFIPAYVPGNAIRFHGCHDQIEHAFRTQQSQPFFPVEFDDLGAAVSFNTLTPGKTVSMGGMEVTPFEQNHPGKSYGYRFQKGGKTFVMSTDSEHGAEASEPDYAFLDEIRDADLLIFDAQYNFQAANTSKKDWGHSSNLIGVELAKHAGVKRLCLFHQEPTLDDRSIDVFLHETRRYAEMYMEEVPLEVLMATDRMRIVI